MSNVATLGIDVKVSGSDRAASDLDRVTASSVKAEGAADRIGEAATASSAKVASAAQVAARAWETQATSATRALAASNDNAKRFSGSMSGIAAQFQDIGVTAAAGMSPLMIGLQQGSQIAGAMEQAMQGGATATAALGMAFRSLLSPLTLISVGLTVLVSAVIQWAFSSSSATDRAADAWKSHNDILKQARDLYPQIKQAAEDYAASAQRLALLETRNAEAIKAKYDSSLSALSSRAAQLNSIVSAGSSLRAKIASPDDITAFNELGSAIQVFMSGVASGTPSVQAFSNSISEIARKSPNAEVRSLAGSLSDVTSATADADTKLAQINGTIDILSGSVLDITNRLNEYVTAMNRLSQGNALGMSTAEMEAEASAALNVAQSIGQATAAYNELQNQLVQSQYAGGKAPLPQAKPNIEGIAPDTGSKKRDVYASALASSQKRVEVLNAETEAQRGLTSSMSDYGYAVTYARERAELLNAAEQQKRAQTPALIAQIDAQASAMANATVEANKLKEAQKKAKEEAAFSSGLMKGFITDLISARKSGESFWSAFKSAGSNVLDKLASKILDSIIDPLFNAGGAGGGGIFGSIGKLFGFASGGFTGNAPASAVAGVVHGGEYVFSKRSVDRIGVGNLEAMHKGYASGGYVASAAPVAANTNTVVQVAPSPLTINGNVDQTTLPAVQKMFDDQRKDIMRSLPAAIRDGQRRGKI